MHFDEWFFFCHFRGDPVMPGVLQVDAILQLAGFFLMHNKHDGHGRALRTGKISFREQVRPHDKLVTYKLDFKKIMNRPTPMAFATAIAEVDGELSAEVDSIIFAMFPDLGYQYP
jgi:3-hydroxyacyl-[acyl-carrier protein] dehydratase/trans-2-decenoyl-[acyl-carrier protein] isomerase